MVENQLNMNQPKCTKKTFLRLVELGYSRTESKEMIGSVLTEEIYYTMESLAPFNEKRFAKKLSKLPDYLWESEDKEIVEPITAPSVGRNELCPVEAAKSIKDAVGLET